ncbi:MAG: DoxX family protein [Bacteroidales bacterium]|nr:DoxX family protein [Bacteroidales bacterium]
MTGIKQLSRYISGLVFIFSGLVKGIDPMGSMYKFIDYFTAFNMDALEPLAYVLGIILCTSEFIIGFAIVTGIRMRIASWGLLLFMIGFTPLTLILAISNPVADCGCFGDAIHLTNWQTFYKNIVILVFAIIVFINRKSYRIISKPLTEWLVIAAMAVLFVLFTGYNRKHLPVVDFRPYKIGTDIREDMRMPEGAPADQFETTLIYEKNGEEKEFTLENYPAEDTTWTFVDSETKLVKKGYTPPIHDFSLSTPDGQDLTDIVLTEPGYNLLMLSLKLSEVDQDQVTEGITRGMECMQEGIGFYLLTSSVPEGGLFEHINVLLVDETTMKTIIRSNPGYLAIKEGVITGKWAGSDIPSKEKFIEILKSSYPPVKERGMLKVVIIISIILVISLLINYTLRKHYKPN